VSPDETLFEVATDKVDTEVPAPTRGVLAEILVQEGETVEVGTRLAVLRIEGEAAVSAGPEATAAAPAAASVAEATPAATARADAGAPPLSPAVRRLLAEHGLEPADVTGTGRAGRIKPGDVRDFVAAGGKPAQPEEPATTEEDTELVMKAAELAVEEPAPEPEPAPVPDRTITPFNRLRQRTAAHMVRSKATSPHVLQAVEVDFHNVAHARQALGPGWKQAEGFSLTWLPFVARAVCQAIADFPKVNASIEGEALVTWRDVHLAIAVDLDFDGLVAPVLRDAQTLSVAGLARAIHHLARRARADELLPDDFSGGTYTISNSGAFGTLITAPIINQPQVAILSTDGVRKRPVVIEGEDGDTIAIRPVGVLAQSFDHRAIDGAYSAAFLNRLREIIEASDWTKDFD
ncbi:MAG: dihydrolipoamide acetyltransferase family protein, partial [Alphaproteobacteria bacterium]